MKITRKKILRISEMIIFLLFYLHIQSFCLEVQSTSDEKPNIIILLGDDVGYEAFGCTGNTFAKTPNVDQLAREGLVFDRFYTTVAQCCPARAELYTGLFPHNNSVLSNGDLRPAKANSKSMVDYLVPLGYKVGLAGKVNFEQGTPFELIEGFPTSGKAKKSKSTEYKLCGVRSFIQGAQQMDQPFCVVVGSIHAHYPWDFGCPRMDEISKVFIPEQYVDTRLTREVLVRHAAEVTELDRQLGDLRGLLKDEGLQDNTIILFLSEQGMSLPRSKWSVYEKGNRSLLIAHYPKKISPGRTNALGQYCDVLPTLIDIAGGDDQSLDGFSFRNVLEGKTQHHRNSVLIYGVDPSRQWALITDEDWRLVWSPYSSDLHLMDLFEDLSREKTYAYVWEEWKEMAKNDSGIYRKITHIISPDEFELYRVDVDYDEIVNLAQVPDYQCELKKLKMEMNRMIVETDKGLYPPRIRMKSKPQRQAQTKK